jgi:hypothetical protein
MGKKSPLVLPYVENVGMCGLHQTGSFSHTRPLVKLKFHQTGPTRWKKMVFCKATVL